MPDRSTNSYIFLTFSIYYSPRIVAFCPVRARSLSKNRKDLHDGCQVNDTEEAEQGSEAAIEICFHSPYQRQDLYRPVPGRKVTRKPMAKKPTAKKATAKKAAVRKVTRKPMAKKPTAKKTVAKTNAVHKQLEMLLKKLAKEQAFRKVLKPSKPMAKKATAKKATAKKATAKKATAAWTVICQQRRHLRRMPS